MAKEVRIAQFFAVPQAEIRAALTDEGFLRRRAELSGGRDVTVTVTTDERGQTTTVVHRRLPAEVPAFARGLVSDAIDLTEEQEWQPMTGAGCTSTFSARFSAPMSATGTIELRPEGSGGARLLSHVILRASVPLIGGKLESLVAEQTQRYLEFTKELLDGEFPSSSPSS